MPGPLLILGPQRPRQNLTEALRAHGLDGPVVTITAGWRHDEGDDDALGDAIREAGGEPVSLPLYSWFEEFSRLEPALARAYRERQARIRAHKELYRIRLHHSLAAVRAIRERLPIDPDLVAPELGSALAAVRLLDTQLVDRVDEIRREYFEAARPWENVRARAFHEQARELIGRARAVVIAGGHVAVLRNRMRFFGLEVLLSRASEEGTALIAWSAGAMALTDRVVLFYDDPPEGPSDPEVLETGLGLLSNVVFFPHGRRRLRLSDPQQVAILASRLGPSHCIALENGAWLEHRGGRWIGRGLPGAAVVLCTDGTILPIEDAP